MKVLYTEKMKTYRGKYVAVRKDNVVAAGKSAKEAYDLAQKVLGEKRKVEGIYYIPQRKDLLTALCVFLTYR